MEPGFRISSYRMRKTLPVYLLVLLFLSFGYCVKLTNPIRQKIELPIPSMHGYGRPVLGAVQAVLFPNPIST